MNPEVEQSYDKNPPCYKKILNMNRCLVCSVTILIVITLSVAFAVLLLKKTDDTDFEICLTSGCIHTASNVLKYIDETVNPCDDFYQFSCGRYLKETIIPEDQTGISSFSTISDIVRDQLKTIIDEPLQRGAPRAHDLMKTFYNICLNTTAIEADGLTTVKAILRDLGTWPLLERANWNEGTFEWKQSVYRCRKFGFGVGYFMAFNVGIDRKNSSRRIINLDQAQLSFSREYLIRGFDEQLVELYYDYMVDIAVLFGANRKAATKEIKDTLDFEMSLANICLPKEERRNLTLLYNPMTVEELQNRYPQILWLEYINKVFDIPDMEITEDEVVNVAVPQFISDLDALLRRTPKRVQANYVMRRAALSTVSYLTEKFRSRQEEYLKTLTGTTETTSRWKECTRLATGSIHLASGASYVRKYFKENAKMYAKEMVVDIQRQFLRILEENDWMDKITKEKAVEKAALMTTYIGYPIELLDDKKIENFYLNLDFNSDNFLKAMKAYTLFRVDYAYKQLREPVDQTDWLRQAFPTVVNAFYASSENSIKFPAGILQGVFFSDDRPRYMNYGGIGYIIGHEITHGFDDRGRQYDKEGNLVNWWEDGTNIAFTKKAQCIIDQYGNYSVPEVGLHLNGINTQGENIADNGGIKVAYLAYQSWVERNGREPRLPGLNYTPNQLFWISAGNVWCAKYRNESLKLRISTGYHSPNRFRIQGPFSNSEYFAKDFACPLGSNMNPVNKCQVW